MIKPITSGVHKKCNASLSKPAAISCRIANLCVTFLWSRDFRGSNFRSGKKILTKEIGQRTIFHLMTTNTLLMISTVIQRMN